MCNALTKSKQAKDKQITMYITKLNELCMLLFISFMLTFLMEEMYSANGENMFHIEMPLTFMSVLRLCVKTQNPWNYFLKKLRCMSAINS